MPTQPLLDPALQIGPITSGVIPYASTYDFTALQPAQTLTVGLNTITLSPFPAGISASLSPCTSYVVTNASWSGNVATYTIGAHSLAVQQWVQISGMTPSGYNVKWVQITATAGTTISVALTPDPGAFSAGGRIIPAVHFLYIADSTSGNETVPITTTNGTSTVQVYCNIGHTSGQWTIKSATAGFQEMIYAQVSGAGSFSGTFSYDPEKTYLLRATVFWPNNGGAYTLWGQNGLSFSIQRWSSFVNGNMFDNAGAYPSAPGTNYIIYDGVGITNSAVASTDGALISCKCQTKIQNCRLTPGWDGVVLNGTSNCELLNNFYASATHSCVTLRRLAATTTVCNNNRICGGTMYPGTSTYGIYITACDGLTISDLIGSGASNAIWIEPASGVYCVSGRIANVFWDGVAVGGIVGIMGAGAIGSWTVIGNQINGQTTATFSLIDFGARSASGFLDGIRIIGNDVNGGLLHGIAVENSSVANAGIVIEGNSSYSNGGDGIRVAFCNASMSNNETIGNTGYGVNLFDTVPQASIVGGKSIGNTAGQVGVAGVSTTSVISISDLAGFSDVIFETANADGTIALGPNPIVSLTGDQTKIPTNFTGGWVARSIHLINMTGGSITVGSSFAANGVRSAWTVPQYQSINLTFTIAGGVGPFWL